MTAARSTLEAGITTWPSCLAVVPYRSGAVEDIAELLTAFGAVKLTGMTDSHELAPLAQRLGELFLPILSLADDAPTQQPESQIYEVRVKNDGEGELDRYGETILSTVKDDFALHTDGYNQPKPPKYMLLLRTDDSDELPRTYLADGMSLLRGLSRAELELLDRPIFPTATGSVSALTVREGRPVLRWNATLVRRWANRVSSDTASLEQAIEIFGRSLPPIVLTDHLHQHECLILDNDRWLHGRSALRTDSVRVLQRAWVDC